MHGGKRPNSGRKPVVPDLKSRDLRDLIKDKELIEKLQNIALKGEGNPTVGEVISAIKILLAKKIPDLQATKISGEINGTLGIIMYPVKKGVGE